MKLFIVLLCLFEADKLLGVGLHCVAVTPLSLALVLQGLLKFQSLLICQIDFLLELFVALVALLIRLELIHQQLCVAHLAKLRLLLQKKRLLTPASIVVGSELLREALLHHRAQVLQIEHLSVV